MKIALGCDHIVTEIKDELLAFFQEQGHEVVDCGTYDKQRTHYPIFGLRVASEVASGKVERGIVICGTGVGISASASKIPGIRAILTRDAQAARLAVQRYDVNVLGMGGRIVGIGLMQEIATSFLAATYQPNPLKEQLDALQQGMSVPSESELELYLKRWDEGFYHD